MPIVIDEVTAAIDAPPAAVPAESESGAADARGILDRLRAALASEQRRAERLSAE